MSDHVEETSHTAASATHGGIKGMVGGLFILLALLLALHWGYKNYQEKQEKDVDSARKTNEARILVAQQAAKENAARLENASEEDFDRRLRFERVTPASFNVDFPAIIAWVGPGGIRVKYPGATEFVPYVAGSFTPPKGAKKMGTYEFSPADPKNPATVKVFEKVWR